MTKFKRYSTRTMRTMNKKACKAAGLPLRSPEFKPFAMWEDENDICSFYPCYISITAVD